MKLHQHITEGQGPVPVKMTLNEIIRDGKVTNHYQTFVLAWLSEFFKNGHKSASLQLENPITFESGATSEAIISSLKAMPDEDHVNLAQYLIDCIDVGETMFHRQESNVVDWIKFVLRKQD